MRKRYRQTVSFGLVLCMLLSLFSVVAYAKGNSAFISGQYEVDLGENIEIELQATDSIGVIAMLCEVEFDNKKLEILRYDDAKLIGGTLTAKTDESPLKLFWMDALAPQNTLVEGTLGTFTFRALKPGKVAIKVTCVEAYTKDGELVPFDNAVIEVDVKGEDIPVIEEKEYTINATAGKNGKINPSGEIKVSEGKQILFIFTPDSGYEVDNVVVNGESVGEMLEYTFESVNADSSIEVSFRKIESLPDIDDSETEEDEADEETDEKDDEKDDVQASTKPSNPSGVTVVVPSGNKDKKEESKPEETKPEEWVNPFSDVKPEDWYYEYVRYANEKQLMNGISETEFAPNNTVTRAMFVTVLYRLEKEPDAEKADFIDVPEGAYYEKAVGWAVQEGIVNGISETEFAPDNTITREQMATIIYRYMEFKGIDTSVDEKVDITAYSDFEEISDYAEDAFRFACNAGIISGTSETTLAPKESATRAQMAAIFQRCETLLLNH